MPAHRVYIETRAVERSPRSPANPPRSPRSPRHILRPRTRSEERIYVYREDRQQQDTSTNTMSDRDRIFREAYEQSYKEIRDLRTNVEEKDIELAEKDALIKELQFDNQNLRRSLDSLSNLDGLQENHIHDLKRKNSKLRKDKDDLNVRVRELRHEMDAKIRPMVDQISALRQEVVNWRLQCESVDRKNKDLERQNRDLERRHARLRENFEISNSQSETYRTQNESLRAENDQLRQIIELQQPLRVFRH